MTRHDVGSGDSVAPPRSPHGASLPQGWPRRVHSGPYPHTPRCQGCTTRKLCNACGRSIGYFGIFGGGACQYARCTRCCHALCSFAFTEHRAGTFERAVQWIASKPMEVTR